MKPSSWQGWLALVCAVGLIVGAVWTTGITEPGAGWGNWVGCGVVVVAIVALYTALSMVKGEAGGDGGAGKDDGDVGGNQS